MHSDRNGEDGAGQFEQPLTWDAEDVDAPKRPFFWLYKNQMLILLMPATNLRVVISAFVYASCCQSNSSLHQ